VSVRDDVVRQLTTVGTFLVTLTVNGAANALPINGQGTGEISDRFSVYVVPAGYVFAIWGLIYLLLAAFTVWQGLPRNRADPAARSIGWLPAIANLLNAAWVLLFHYEYFALTVPVMVALLLTLIAIHLRLWGLRSEIRGTTFWVVRVPFSVYLGWITVATIANIAQTGQAIGIDPAGFDPAFIASGVLLLGLLIAVRFVTEFDDVAYGLVIVWAYAGVAVKEADTMVVAITAAAGALVVAVLALRSVIRHLRDAGPSVAAA
jgi:hypothetical protein